MIIIVVVGLGYVGLFLVVEFGKKYCIIGFDFFVEKIEVYRCYIDFIGEVSSEDLRVVMFFEVGIDLVVLWEVDFVVVVVLILVDDVYQFDFSLFVGFLKVVGQNLKQGVIVVYELMVYFGVIEEVCILIFEWELGKIWKKDFFVGYFFECINLGDKECMVIKIVKVVFGDM